MICALVEATLQTLPPLRQEPCPDAPQQVCADAGSDYPQVKASLEAYGYQTHIRPNQHNREKQALAQGRPVLAQPESIASSKGLEVLKQPRRPVTERLFSWLNRWRRLLIRWEKLAQTYLAFLHLASALICFHQSDRFRSSQVFG